METQNQTTEKTKSTQKAGGLIFVGSMFIGMAAGYYFGSFNIGMFAGMGIGFILMAVVIISQANRR